MAEERLNELTRKVIGIFFAVQNELGFGFLESVYRRAMCVALRQAGIRVEEEVPVPVEFRGEIVGVFRADLIVEGVVLLELKACDDVSKAHEAQVLHYLRASTLEVGFVMAFGDKARFKRLYMPNSSKRSSTSLALDPS